MVIEAWQSHFPVAAYFSLFLNAVEANATVQNDLQPLSLLLCTMVFFPPLGSCPFDHVVDLPVLIPRTQHQLQFLHAQLIEEPPVEAVVFTISMSSYPCSDMHAYPGRHVVSRVCSQTAKTHMKHIWEVQS